MKITIGFDKYMKHDKPEIIISQDKLVVIIHFFGLSITVFRGWCAKKIMEVLDGK